MAKLWIVAAVCVAALVQVTLAKDAAEVLNIDLREHVKAYEKFLAEDDGSHKEDLQKLIDITETGLKAETLDEKQTILKDITEKFTPEFNTYVTAKFNEYHMNNDIQSAIDFHHSLLSGAPEHKDEIEKTIATLENLLKETDLTKKEEGFLSINKSFSPEFQEFLKNNALPKVNMELQSTHEFFENVLAESDVKFQSEITALKAEAEAALMDTVSVDDKQKALYKITNPENRELFEFLQKKFAELN